MLKWHQSYYNLMGSWVFVPNLMAIHSLVSHHECQSHDRDEKSGGSQKADVFILCGPHVPVQIYIIINPTVLEIFQSGPKGCTNQSTDGLTLLQYKLYLLKILKQSSAQTFIYSSQQHCFLSDFSYTFVQVQCYQPSTKANQIIQLVYTPTVTSLFPTVTSFFWRETGVRLMYLNVSLSGLLSVWCGTYFSRLLTW